MTAIVVFDEVYGLAPGGVVPAVAAFYVVMSFAVWLALPFGFPVQTGYGWRGAMWVGLGVVLALRFSASLAVPA